MCGTYKVSVGIDSDSKGFVPFSSTPASKRLLHKKEFTTTAAWPSHYNETQVTELEQGKPIIKTTGIAPNQITTSTYNTCNGYQKYIDSSNSSYTGSDVLAMGNQITALFPHKSEIFPVYMVGSSSLDPSSTNYNTEKCTSRYGVQDLAGNLREYSSEQIFCNYAADQVFLEDSSGGSVPYIEGREYGGALSAVVNSDLSNSGSCSLYKTGADTSLGNANSFGSIFNSNGTINNHLVPIVTDSRYNLIDPSALLFLRSGDGNFLDFMNFAPPLNATNTLSITTNTVAGYFNPATGIPLLCDNNICDSNSTDNRIVSTATLNANNASDPHVAISDFPTNNGTITNLGISELSIEGRTGTGYRTSTPNLLYEFPTYYSNYYYTSYYYDFINHSNSTLNQVFLPPDTLYNQYLYRSYFKVSRDTPMYMVNGGSNENKAGRYTMDIGSRTVVVQDYMSNKYGGRCAVLINAE